MYKFNYKSIPFDDETQDDDYNVDLDIRYFLFDCVQANYKPQSQFLGPSYKQAFITEDIYNKDPILVLNEIPSFVARIIGNDGQLNQRYLIQNDQNISVQLKYPLNYSVKYKINYYFRIILVLLLIY